MWLLLIPFFFLLIIRIEGWIGSHKIDVLEKEYKIKSLTFYTMGEEKIYYNIFSVEVELDKEHREKFPFPDATPREVNDQLAEYIYYWFKVSATNWGFIVIPYMIYSYQY